MLESLVKKILDYLVGFADTFNSATVSTFTTIPLEVGQTKIGTPLGQGKCKAVRLRLNNYDRNTENKVTIEYIYYGDAKAQEMELRLDTTSHLIITDNLNKIYIRNPKSDIRAFVQVEILN